MWITSQALTAAEAEAALRESVLNLDEYLASGQMEMVEFGQWYMADERFDPDGALQKVAGKLATALGRGFDGVRLSGSTFSLARDDWEAFVRYEAAIERIVGSKRILAMCTYSLQKWSMSEIFDVIATHDFALTKEEGCWKASKSFSRQRIEQSLTDSEARLRATIEGVGDGIITTDETGAILSINPAATRMFGYSLYDLLGQNIGTLSPTRAGSSVSPIAFRNWVKASARRSTKPRDAARTAFRSRWNAPSRKVRTAISACLSSSRAT